VTQSSLKVGKEFHPRRAKNEMKNLRSRWHQALGRAMPGIYEEREAIRRGEGLGQIVNHFVNFPCMVRTFHGPCNSSRGLPSASRAA
jgi:hypothetical protein